MSPDGRNRHRKPYVASLLRENDNQYTYSHYFSIFYTETEISEEIVKKTCKFFHKMNGYAIIYKKVDFTIQTII